MPNDVHNRPPAVPADSKPARVIADLLMQAGIRIGGAAPWDIDVHSSEFYRRVLTGGSLGLGEAYMDGLWDVPALDQFVDRVIGAALDRKLGGWQRLRILAAVVGDAVRNRQSRRRAYQVGQRHYDIGNDVFAAMLDPRMVYSCAYWAEADDLAAAQRAKLDLICRKLALEPGERLLDIGCGWGGLARHAAVHYGAEVIGITVSQRQLELARERCAGLPVELALMDYRDLQGRFDKIASVGMFEHVGMKNYRSFFDTVRRVLSDQGLVLLQSIGTHEASAYTDPWIDTYIFPNGQLPSARQLAGAIEGHLRIEDWHSFGQDYDRTLMAWHDNFERAWPRLSQHYDTRFHRMWTYYLLSSAGFFRSRSGRLWQLVLSTREGRHAYRSIR